MRQQIAWFSRRRFTCSAVWVVFDPGLQHDASKAVAGHVDVAVQPLVVRLAHTVVHGSCDLDRVREVSEPAGGDTGPETNSREVVLYLCNQWSILLPRNLRGFLQQFGWAWKDVGT